jgi:hypothetical protein
MDFDPAAESTVTEPGPELEATGQGESEPETE